MLFSMSITADYSVDKLDLLIHLLRRPFLTCQKGDKPFERHKSDFEHTHTHHTHFFSLTKARLVAGLLK